MKSVRKRECSSNNVSLESNDKNLNNIQNNAKNSESNFKEYATISNNLKMLTKIRNANSVSKQIISIISITDYVGFDTRIALKAYKTIMAKC